METMEWRVYEDVHMAYDKTCMMFVPVDKNELSEGRYQELSLNSFTSLSFYSFQTSSTLEISQDPTIKYDCKVHTEKEERVYLGENNKFKQNLFKKNSTSISNYLLKNKLFKKHWAIVIDNMVYLSIHVALLREGFHFKRPGV